MDLEILIISELDVYFVGILNFSIESTEEQKLHFGKFCF